MTKNIGVSRNDEWRQLELESGRFDPLHRGVRRHLVVSESAAYRVGQILSLIERELDGPTGRRLNCRVADVELAAGGARGLLRPGACILSLEILEDGEALPEAGQGLRRPVKVVLHERAVERVLAAGGVPAERLREVAVKQVANRVAAVLAGNEDVSLSPSVTAVVEETLGMAKEREGRVNETLRDAIRRGVRMHIEQEIHQTVTAMTGELHQRLGALRAQIDQRVEAHLRKLMGPYLEGQLRAGVRRRLVPDEETENQNSDGLQP